MKGSTAVTCAVVAAAAMVATLSPARAATSLEGVPSYQHVGVLVLENESESTTWGSGSVATYLNSLVPGGAFATNYFADGHVSLDNYITMTSGLPGNPSTYSDCLSQNLFQCVATVTAQEPTATTSNASIFDQAEAAGLSWKEYADSLPSPCFHGDLTATATPPDPYQGNSTTAPAGNYADRHNPVNYYNDLVTDATRCAAHDVPFADPSTGLAADIAANTVPNFFFITPDTCHDGHDSPCAAGTPSYAGPCSATAEDAGGLTSADCWLQAYLPSLLTYLSAHDGVLFITTDEGSTSDTAGCCTGGQGGAMGVGGKVGLLALGPGVAVGTASTTSYDHVSLLRTVEDALGISTYLNNASSIGATAMSTLFTQPASNTPDVHFAVLIPILGVAILVYMARRRSPRAR